MIRLDKKENCCGCSACYSICSKNAIKMKSDKEGFLYPEINEELCINCGLCDKVCPIINKTEEIQCKQEAYLVQNKDKKILKESTSGGAFTAIAEYVIDNNGVVFGASFDEDFKVMHSYAESKDELVKFRNSKYVQSDIDESFQNAKKFLKSGRLVCFSGTPCQIEGLKKFLMKDYDNLITVDVVCHAVPSPLIWNKYRNFISNSENIQNAKFRDKEPYGYDYSQISIETDKKTYFSGVESDAYLRAFFSNLSDRPSCYSCNFKKRYRVSDITIWDCFESYKFNKQLDNNLGVTRMLVHSEKGKNIINKILDKFTYTDVSADSVVSNVREMFNSVPKNERREQFFNDAIFMEEREFFEKYFPDTLKVKTERIIRHTSEKLGIYRFVKRTAKKILRK